jgi:hypothetical protein
MSGFAMSIDTANAAFEDDNPGELVRILREVADLVEAGSDGGTLRDINGNSVGVWTIASE